MPPPPCPHKRLPAAGLPSRLGRAAPLSPGAAQQVQPRLEQVECHSAQSWGGWVLGLHTMPVGGAGAMWGHVHSPPSCHSAQQHA